MDYTLTLTQAERKAIDWVGHRYSNGNALYRLLWGKSYARPDMYDWDYDGELTFTIPENVAWEIRDNAEQEDGFWPCFDGDLASKLQYLCDCVS